MNAFITVLIGVALIILHIYLSKKENKLLGLILPGINILFSLNAVLGFALFNIIGDMTTIEVVIQCVYIFLMYNVSTLILLSIYFSCRKKLNKHKEINKMNIQDLN